MDRPWIVLKYGGTSVATADRWARILDRAGALTPTHRVWITASALAGVSNQLDAAVHHAIDGGSTAPAIAAIRAQHEALADALQLDDAARVPLRTLLQELEDLLAGIALVREASPRLHARVMSFGELASTHIGLAALRADGQHAVRLDARDLLTSTDDPDAPEATRFLEARVTPRHDPSAAEALADDADVVLTQGFLARTPDGDTALLGRGGSDTSAALFAALLGAERLEIWTDVHGLFTTDPNQFPGARLLRRVRYREARELAAMGAKVLHPRCLDPVAPQGIPVEIRNTLDPDGPVTRIGPEGDDDPAVLAVIARRGVPLLTVRTLEMWGAPGFLARAFDALARHGISVDLVATSQSAVSVTLDHVPGGLRGAPMRRALDALGRLGEVDLLPDRAVVSIVGRHIRTVLPDLGRSFGAFAEKRVHLVSASSEDLDLAFVVDAEEAPRLVRDLHGRLFGTGRTAPWLGPTWGALTRGSEETVDHRASWWRDRRADLLAVVADGQPRYALDLDTVRARAEALRDQLPHVGGRYYAMKANPEPAVLRAVVEAGMGIECVSIQEVRHARAAVGDRVPILFTPNFCPVGEYAEAYTHGAQVTIDGPDVLEQAPAIFRGRAVAVRLDPGTGLGHHDKVRTAGARQKFGHPVDDLDGLVAACTELDVTVVGLHAHVGSGILDADAWSHTAHTLAAARARFPEVRWVDVGGGLGVVERAGQEPLDLRAMDDAIAAIPGLDGVEIRIEPGRYLVSEAGVLLLPVTQVRRKGGVTFVGCAAGMNHLIRPALYGAWHGIHNLTRLHDPPGEPVDVVGPICETGDILGRARHLPPTVPGDVLVVENAGAYGIVMASRYNLRDAAEQVVLAPRR